MTAIRTLDAPAASRGRNETSAGVEGAAHTSLAPVTPAASCQNPYSVRSPAQLDVMSRPGSVVSLRRDLRKQLGVLMPGRVTLTAGGERPEPSANDVWGMSVRTSCRVEAGPVDTPSDTVAPRPADRDDWTAVDNPRPTGPV
jgi:hypothetical protein